MKKVSTSKRKGTTYNIPKSLFHMNYEYYFYYTKFYTIIEL